MKIHYQIIFISAILSAVLWSCGEEKKTLFEKLLKEKEGILRGFETGETYDEVLSAEKNYTNIEKGNDYIYYDFDLGNEESYTLTYNFYQDKLYEITMDVYLNSQNTARQLFNEFKNHYNQKFGEGVLSKDGYTTWYTQNKLSQKVEIAIKENSESYGFFTITINNLDY
jgi:hypothetical protein